MESSHVNATRGIPMKTNGIRICDNIEWIGVPTGYTEYNYDLR